MPHTGGIPGYYLNDRDPLGILVQARARQHRRAFERSEAEKYRALQREFPQIGLYGPRPLSGPFPDPQWEGLFQALAEAGADRVEWEGGQFGPLGSTIDPTNLAQIGLSARFRGSRGIRGVNDSTHISNVDPNASIEGIRAATGGYRSPSEIRPRVRISRRATRPGRGQQRLPVQGQRGGSYAGGR